MKEELKNKIKELLENKKCISEETNGVGEEKDGLRIVEIVCDPGRGYFSTWATHRKTRKATFVVSEPKNYLKEQITQSRYQTINPQDDSIKWFFDVINIINWDADYSLDYAVLDKGSYNWTAILTYNNGKQKVVHGEDRLPEYTDILKEIISNIYEDDNATLESDLFK